MHGARRRLHDKLRSIEGLRGRVECVTVDRASRPNGAPVTRERELRRGGERRLRRPCRRSRARPCPTGYLELCKIIGPVPGAPPRRILSSIDFVCCIRGESICFWRNEAKSKKCVKSITCSCPCAIRRPAHDLAVAGADFEIRPRRSACPALAPKSE
jgi:hypothetical protein